MENNEITKWIGEINKKLNNHMTDIVADMRVVQTDIAWIKRFFWIIATASIASLIGAIINLIIK